MNYVLETLMWQCTFTSFEKPSLQIAVSIIEVPKPSSLIFWSFSDTETNLWPCTYNLRILPLLIFFFHSWSSRSTKYVSLLPQIFSSRCFYFCVVFLVFTFGDQRKNNFASTSVELFLFFFPFSLLSYILDKNSKNTILQFCCISRIPIG